MTLPRVPDLPIDPAPRARRPSVETLIRQRMDKHTSQEFRHNPADAVLLLLTAFACAVLGGAAVVADNAVWAVIMFAWSAAWLLDAFWSERTPYVRTTTRYITVFPAVVRPRQVCAWATVEGVRLTGERKLQLRLRDGATITLRLARVQEDDRALLISEVERLWEMSARARSSGLSE